MRGGASAGLLGGSNATLAAAGAVGASYDRRFIEGFGKSIGERLFLRGAMCAQRGVARDVFCCCSAHTHTTPQRPPPPETHTPTHTGVIAASEIGDKTFFIAAIMAMRHARLTVFSGAIAALAVMTVLAVALGWAAPALVSGKRAACACARVGLCCCRCRSSFSFLSLSSDHVVSTLVLCHQHHNTTTTTKKQIPKTWTHYAATALFFFFGAKTLWDAYNHEEGGESELEAVEQELADGRGSRDRLVGYKGGVGGGGGGGAGAGVDGVLNGGDDDSGKGRARGGAAGLLARAAQVAACLVSPVFINAFTLTFLAEWGDRSQIATIGLAASADVFGVTLGAIIGHAACTAAAVLGGRHLAAHIDERTVGFVGGGMFLLFGLHSLYEGPQ